MASFIYVLIETVVARLLDPVVLVAAVVVIVVLGSGFAARLVESLESVRWPRRDAPMTSDQSHMSRTASG